MMYQNTPDVRMGSSTEEMSPSPVEDDDVSPLQGDNQKDLSTTTLTIVTCPTPSIPDMVETGKMVVFLHHGETINWIFTRPQHRPPYSHHFQSP